MEIKKIITNTFKNTNELIEFRYHSSKIFLVLSSLVFFINYLFVATNFYESFSFQLLPFSYSIFILSLCSFWYFFTINFLKEKKEIKIALIFVFIALFLIFLYPIIWVKF